MDFSEDDTYELYLQPLADIHLNSKEEGEFEAGTDKVYTYVFALIAILILIIACINFMNMATANSAGRGKEIGLKKVLGARRSQLTGQSPIRIHRRE